MVLDIIQQADTGIIPGTTLSEHKYSLTEVEAIVKEAQKTKYLKEKIKRFIEKFWNLEKVWCKNASDDVNQHLDFWKIKQLRDLEEKELE